MKLPSVKQILENTVRTFLRFPFVLINSFVCTFSVVILIDHEGPSQPSVLFKILMATILGIPLLTGFATMAEKQKWSRGLSVGLQIVGILLLIGYGCSVPYDLAEAPAVHILRLLIIVIGVSLFFSFAPFISRGEINGFWHYNKHLLLRLITTSIYSVVLYAGLALALAALDNLFGMYVPGKRYAELWFIILGICAVWTFLAGIPEDTDQMETVTDYPKGIKIFAQYILFPLVLVYLIILYAYITKILITWEWPQGWVGRLILGFAATGISSLLLLFPVRDNRGNVWIKEASRWFYVAMIPMVIILLLALWRRISEYGITEQRYIGAALGIWLAGIILYFILSKAKSIKTIPVSLCVSALIISFGPWGVFSVSENSQVNRLQNLLTKNSILADGKIQKVSETIPGDDALQISSILKYLYQIHGYDRIQPWFTKSLKEDSTSDRLTIKEPALIAKMMGVNYVNVWYSSASNEFRFLANPSDVFDVQDYDRMIRDQHLSVKNQNNEYSDQAIHFVANSKIDTITFTATPDSMENDFLVVGLNTLFNQLATDYGTANVNNIPSEKMMFLSESKNIKVKIYFSYIWLHKEENLFQPASYGIDILYRIHKD